MTSPATIIDPSLPVSWEDPQTLRVGFDRAVARVCAPSARQQRLVHALRSGVCPDRLPSTLRETGSSRSDWAALTSQLAGTLMPKHPDLPPRSVRIGVIGSGIAQDELLRTLESAGLSAGVFTPQRRDWDLVVVIERFIELPVLEGIRLAAGLPQLLIRLSDRSVGIGPLIEGEGSPCLSCVTLGDLQSDPALAVVAAQLVGTVPATETRTVVPMVAALAVGLIGHWLAGSTDLARSRWRLPIVRSLPLPRISTERVAPHPDCGCQLTGASTVPPPQ